MYKFYILLVLDLYPILNNQSTKRNPTGCGEKIGHIITEPFAKALISIEIGDINGVVKVLVRIRVIPSK